jgi:hypothetical protein
MLSKKLFITYRQREQAERMAAKWEARAEAFWNQEKGGSNDGWGYTTAGYCKTVEDMPNRPRLTLSAYMKP